MSPSTELMQLGFSRCAAIMLEVLLYIEGKSYSVLNERAHINLKGSVTSLNVILPSAKRLYCRRYSILLGCWASCLLPETDPFSFRPVSHCSDLNDFSSYAIVTLYKRENLAHWPQYLVKSFSSFMQSIVRKSWSIRGGWAWWFFSLSRPFLVKAHALDVINSFKAMKC